MSELDRPHRSVNFHNCKGEQSPYKIECPISLDSRGTDMCAAYAVAHALACQGLKVTKQTAYLIHDEARFFKQTGKAKDNLQACVMAAIQLGYASEAMQITSFDMYKTFVHSSPIVLGFPMYEGMEQPDSGDGFITVWKRRPLLDKKGNQRMHAMCATGRDPRFWRGRFSFWKNSGGRDWGNNGECKIFDADLKWLFKTNKVRAYQLFVAKG